MDDTLQMTIHFFVDVDKNGTPLGIELLAVERFLAQKEPVNVTLDLEKQANVLTTIKNASSLLADELFVHLARESLTVFTYS